MKRQQRIIETSWARGYARVLYELKVPAEDIEETRNLFAQTPELLEVLTNPTIFIAKKRRSSTAFSLFHPEFSEGCLQI